MYKEILLGKRVQRYILSCYEIWTTTGCCWRDKEERWEGGRGGGLGWVGVGGGHYCDQSNMWAVPLTVRQLCQKIHAVKVDLSLFLHNVHPKVTFYERTVQNLKSLTLRIFPQNHQLSKRALKHWWKNCQHSLYFRNVAAIVFTLIYKKTRAPVTTEPIWKFWNYIYTTFSIYRKNNTLKILPIIFHCYFYFCNKIEILFVCW